MKGADSMKNSSRMAWLGLILALMCIGGCQTAPEPAKKAAVDQDLLYQVSTINALMQGIYDGDTTYGEIQDKGNLGIGTFQALDGEMVMIDGVFYQIKSDGKVYAVKPEMIAPFADLTYYSADQTTIVKNIDSVASLQKAIEPLITNKNLFYAIRVDGAFSYIKVRSVPAQVKPYPLLSEAVKNQQVFEYQNVEGTILGFWSPEYINGINVPGYHLHFISKDRQKGGHLLDCKMSEATAGVDVTDNFILDLPQGQDFAQSNLAQDQSKQVQKVER